MSSLPASVRVALWATAAFTGHVPLESVCAHALPDIDHVTGDLDHLTIWRDLGERVVLVALPRPGRLTGMPRASLELAGAATEAGECVYVPGVGAALVPTIEQFGPSGDRATQVTWTAYGCEPTAIHALEALSLHEIELHLRSVLTDATRAIDRLDAKPWSGSPARAVADERVGRTGWGLPDGIPLRARRVLSMAATVATTTDVGLLIEAQHTVSGTVAEQRRALLAELRDSAERALADATNVAALALAGLRGNHVDQ